MEPQQNADPLDTNVDDIDLSYPIIPAGIHEFKITKAETKENNAKTGKNLVLTLQATSPKQATNGDTVQNFTLTNNISLVETEKYFRVDIGKKIAAVAQAAEIRGVKANEVIANPTMLVGRVVQVKTSISQERTDKETGRIYEPRSEVHSFVVKK